MPRRGSTSRSRPAVGFLLVHEFDRDRARRMQTAFLEGARCCQDHTSQWAESRELRDDGSQIDGLRHKPFLSRRHRRSHDDSSSSPRCGVARASAQFWRATPCAGAEGSSGLGRAGASFSVGELRSTRSRGYGRSFRRVATSRAASVARIHDYEQGGHRSGDHYGGYQNSGLCASRSML